MLDGREFSAFLDPGALLPPPKDEEDDEEPLDLLDQELRVRPDQHVALQAFRRELSGR